MIKEENTLLSSLKRIFNKKNTKTDFYIGKPDEQGFAPLIKNGVETNVRLYVWDRETFERLKKIGSELQLNSKQ